MKYTFFFSGLFFLIFAFFVLPAAASCSDPPIRFGIKPDCPSTYLRQGSTGLNVRELQNFLKGEGYDLGGTGPGKDGVDGDYGNKTVVAVRDLQKKNGLSVDGIFGQETAEVLFGGSSSGSGGSGGSTVPLVCGRSSEGDKSKEDCCKACFGLSCVDAQNATPGFLKWNAICYDDCWDSEKKPAKNPACWCFSRKAKDDYEIGEKCSAAAKPKPSAPDIPKQPAEVLPHQGQLTTAETATKVVQGLSASGEKAFNVSFSDPGVFLAQAVGLVVNTVLTILGLIFLSLIVFGSVKWLIAAGDETKLKEAQGTIMQAAIGLAIVLSAYSISVFITNIVLKSIGK